jgi:hypothetical protein
MIGCDICGRIWDNCECDNLSYDEAKDLGSHYRHEFKGVKIDPYRILTEYDVTCPVAQHIIKKLLRGESKGHSNEEVWDEVKQAVDRKFEMMEEDK